MKQTGYSQEQQYVLDSFRENFESKNINKMVIYGLGNNTQLLLTEFPEFPVVGLMDMIRTGDIVFGKQVLSFEEVEKLSIDCILVLARTSNIRIIWRRIEAFCRKNGIKGYDINGNELGVQENTTNIDDAYYHTNRNELINLVQQHDIISFDIFDTLLVRKTLYPRDIFYLAEMKANKHFKEETGFARQRIVAEEELNRYTIPTIYEIYERLREQTGWSKNKCDELMQFELTEEKNNLIPRASMLELLKWIMKQGKQVYLISDMYLPKEILRKLLEANGIQEQIKIFVSCEEKVSKYNGLYEKYISNIQKELPCNLKAGFLHIGDNEEADGNCAKKSGIDPFLIKSSEAMLEISKCSNLFAYAKDLPTRYMLGYFVASAFNDPFLFYETKGRIDPNSSKELGDLLVGPVVTAFLYWLANQISGKEQYIIFGARDGYLINELYNRMKQLFPEKLLSDHDYILTSRSVCVIAGLLNEADIQYAATLAFSGTPEQLLEKRFFLNSNEILPYQGEALASYIHKHIDCILEKSEEYRQGYVQYLSKFKRLKEQKDILFFDFVSSGTCQLFLQRILQRKLKGIYFTRIMEDSKEKQELQINSLLETKCVYEKQYHLVNDYFFLENVITAVEATVHYFTKEGLPVYFSDNRNGDELDRLKEMHQGISNYFDGFLQQFGWLCECSSMISMADEIFGCVTQEYRVLDEEKNNQTIVEDEFCNRTFKQKECI